MHETCIKHIFDGDDMKVAHKLFVVIHSKSGFMRQTPSIDLQKTFIYALKPTFRNLPPQPNTLTLGYIYARLGRLQSIFPPLKA